jgi:predicted chitinase
MGVPEPIGKDLGELLRRLRGHISPRFAIGPQEMVDSHRVALALFGADDPPARLGDIADFIAPIVTRTAEERRAFDRIVADLARVDPGEVGDRGGDRPPPLAPSRARRLVDAVLRRRDLLGFVTGFGFIILAVVLALWPDGQDEIRSTANRTAPTVDRPAVKPSAPQVDEGPVIAGGASEDYRLRLAFAANLHGGAPTLREAAATLGPTAAVPLDPADYLRRLRALTALPADRPLDLAGSAVADAAPRLGWAIAEIETPGRAPTLAGAAAGVAALPKSTGCWARIATPGDAAERRLARAVAGTRPQSTIAATVAGMRTALRSVPGLPDCTAMADQSDAVLARGYALSHPDWHPADAPWRPQRPDQGHAPSWAAWLVAAAALLLMAAGLLPLLDPRRAFLRQRLPRFAADRARLLGDLPALPLGDAETFVAIRKALQRREPRPTRQIDVDATVRRTIARGGHLVEPRMEALKSAPDYLVLVERTGLNDLEADRAAALIAPLRTGAIGVDLFYYSVDPSLVHPEGGGAPVRIEALMTRFPHHRLLLLSAGEGMLDLFTGRARGGYARLQHWRRRGMLTSIPRAEWAREETLIAGEFGAPVARATAGGLLALSDRLFSDHGGNLSRLLGDGDESAPRLPRDLHRILRRLPATPGDGDAVAVDALLTELSWYPDAPGFEWLCALAVYPSVTIDLALHLGQRLPEAIDGPADGRRLHNPTRLAALTRLPWLRKGRIPDWLRRRLIERLDPRRAAQVRGLILDLVRGAHRGSPATANRAGYARETDAALAPDRLLDDEVLVEFLRSGRAEDLEVVLPRPKNWWGRLAQIDWIAAGALILALAYAVAAFFVAPSPDDGTATAALWLPLALVALALLVTLATARSRTVWRDARRIVARLAPPALRQRILLPTRPDGRAVVGDADLALLRGFTPLARSAMPLLALALLLPGLWLVRDLRGDRHALAAADGLERIVATSPDGLVAMTDGADRRTITIDRIDGSGIRQSFTLLPMAQTKIIAGGAPQRTVAGNGAIVALAVRAVAGDTRVAIATADGAIIVRGGVSGQRLVRDPSDRMRYPDGQLPDFAGPPLLFLTATGALVHADHLAGGVSVLGVDLLGSGGETSNVAPRITALGGLTDGLVVAGRADGSVEAVRFESKPVLRIRYLAGARGLPQARLAGAVRRILPLTVGKASRPAFLAVADDGTALLGKIDPVRGLATMPVPRIAALGLGPVVPWREPPPVLSAPIAIIEKSGSNPPLSGRRTKGALVRQPSAPPVIIGGPTGAGGGTSLAAQIPLPEGALTPSQTTPPVPTNEFPALVMERGAVVKEMMAGSANSRLVEQTAAAVARYGRSSDLDTGPRLAAFLATLAASTGFANLEENLNYTAAGLRKVWPRQFPSTAIAAKYAGNPEMIANRVYAGRFGNGDESSGDGWRYRGRGFLMLTGRGNYLSYSRTSSIDLVAAPDRAADPDVGLPVALAFWQQNGCSALADAGDLQGIWRRVNGGTTNLDRFTAYYKRFLDAVEPSGASAAAS